MANTEERIQKLIAESIYHKEYRVNLKKSPDSLGLDSLDMIELEMAIEDEFHIVISDQDLAGFYKKPLSELVRYVEEKEAVK